MTDDKYGELTERHAKEIAKDINRMSYNDLTPVEQEFYQLMALMNVDSRFGEANKGDE